MNLYEGIEILVGQNEQDIPSFIEANLSPSISLRPYQEDSLKNFLYYFEKYRQRIHPTHLLFHMATGSGKTVIMAALIIYLYKQGYRNFMFFVNSKNIIEKTKKNFLNTASSKHLFSDSITIDGRRVDIREVSNFDDAVEENINIHFTTIQRLHNNLNNPKENAVTYEDFEDKNLVLISDEAHHINTLTKKGSLTKEEKENQNSWEGTVQKMFSSNSENLLLEFTATINLENENVKKKYSDKIIYNYPLRQFRLDGYSKEVELRQSHIPPIDRMLQAIMFSQYRLKVAEKHELQIKPVVMMKSKTIKESKENTKRFVNMISNLSGGFIKKSRLSAPKNDTLKMIYDYLFDELKLSYDNFALEMKESFSDDKIININDPAELERYQVLVNSLEDKDNEIRIIFAVDKLNEGWDVLNLFDIVRLYDTRDAGKNTIGKTTMQEAQLIGRGARYYPFVDSSKEDEPKEKRKYDKEYNNPMRILEQLYYHCSHNPSYISEIKVALQKAGLLDEPQKVLLELKDSFKKTKSFQNGVVYVNKKIENKNENKHCLRDYLVADSYEYIHKFTHATREDSALIDKKKSSGYRDYEKKKVTFTFSEIRRVADSIELFRFDKIKKLLPNINSMNALFNDIRDFAIAVEGDSDWLANLSKNNRKDIASYVLREIEKTINKNSTKFIGSEEFEPRLIKDIIVDKRAYINNSNKLAELEKYSNEGVFDGEWYVYDKNIINSLEKKFIEYVGSKAKAIMEVFEEFHLIRNESCFKLYDFKSGKGVEPDFLLFANNKKKEAGSMVYELFIESKGDHLKEHDEWKSEFLSDLKKKYRVPELYKTDNYNIVGLPFYEKTQPRIFEEKFEEILGID